MLKVRDLLSKLNHMSSSDTLRNRKDRHMTRRHLKTFTAAFLGLLLMPWSCSADVAAGVAAVKRKDYGKALAEFSEEAKKDNPSGMYYLGRLYEQGLGVPADQAQAAKWYRKAFETLSTSTKEKPAGSAAKATAATSKPTPPSEVSPPPAVIERPADIPPDAPDPATDPEGWKAYCHMKACASTRKVITGAIELYNLDRATKGGVMLRGIADEGLGNNGVLVRGGYLKEPIQKPCPDCSYVSEGSLLEDGKVKCVFHGFAE